MGDVKEYKLEGVLWREYEFVVENLGTYGFQTRTYKIDNPVAFYWAPGHTTHRVVDLEGILHLVPAPGEKGCVMRQKKESGLPSVAF
jgi:hypothetical protein